MSFVNHLIKQNTEIFRMSNEGLMDEYRTFFGRNVSSIRVHNQIKKEVNQLLNSIDGVRFDDIVSQTYWKVSGKTVNGRNFDFTKIKEQGASPLKKYQEFLTKIENYASFLSALEEN